MTKQEFENIIRNPVNDDDFKIIEKVYAYHPSISDSYGKEEIASIYISFGMRVIKDMLPTANHAFMMEEKIRVCKMEHEKHLAELKSNYEDFKKGLI